MNVFLRVDVSRLSLDLLYQLFVASDMGNAAGVV